jgi:apolipoprotein N-acyltransferase
VTSTVRIALALASGVLYALAFPPFDLGALAWIATVPLILAVLDGTLSRGRAFALGWITGTIACSALVSSSVAESALRFFAASTPVAWLAGLLAAQVYGALYFGLFAVLAREIGSRRVRAPVRAALGIAAAWVTCELLRSNIGDGCPWILLAHAQHRFPTMLQIADLGGASAVSFVVALVGAALAIASDAVLERRGDERRVVARSVLLAVTVLVLVVAYGRIQLSRWAVELAGETVRVVGIQSNLPDEWRYSLREQPRALRHMLELTERAARERPDLVLWPENAVSVAPGSSLTGLADAAALLPAGAGLLAGAPRAVQTRPGRAALHNSAFLVDAVRGVQPVYDKIDLTPWAERPPWPVGAWRDVVPASATGYTAGAPAPLPDLRGHLFGVTICSEAIYAARVADQARRGATFLVNLANDGWFGDRPALAQHAAAVALRAVETRRFLMRVTPTGISTVVAPSGAVLETAAPGTESLLVADVTPIDVLTPYVRLGDVFGWACVGAVVLEVLLAGRARRVTAPARGSRAPRAAA